MSSKMKKYFLHVRIILESWFIAMPGAQYRGTYIYKLIIDVYNVT